MLGSHAVFWRKLLPSRAGLARQATHGRTSLEQPAVASPSYRLGVLLALFTAFLWSFSGLLMRSIEAAEAWEIIFYRSIGVALGAGLVVCLRYRRRTLQAFRRIGAPGLAAAVCLSAASLAYLQAIHLTTIANLSFLLAASPFFAAALAWLVLRERVALRTWVAAALALCGVTAMVFEGLVGGSLMGNLLSLLCAILSGGYAVALRCGRLVDMTPAVVVSGLLALSIAAPMVVDFSISWHDLGICLLQGFVISALCNSLFAYAARAVPAAEIILLTLLETVLSPLWVWLAIAERPSDLTLLGGGVILLAIAGHAWAATRSLPRAVPPCAPQPV